MATFSVTAFAMSECFPSSVLLMRSCTGGGLLIGFFFFLFDTLNGRNRVALPTSLSSEGGSLLSAGEAVVAAVASPYASSAAGLGTGLRLKAASLLVFRLTPAFGAATRFGAGRRLLKPLNAPAVRARFAGGPSALVSRF
ncbi:hypothetical protein DOTSEDRAFT_70824 [Dothistroma septosporum NZE10]|uniref:Uncharacterized protein n=1 Tax=Dothistroma septosporum (strain NZE10 / CBS 128990) TaxID=675120 RepID=N1PNA6_DOTSN|nr:hypothetical protein DOTSEDRAFT_70824 [Dothistroma septosporum NZE10]